jgi:protein arginine kinase activator
MVCDICKERDSVYTLHQVLGDTKSNLQLCEKCAAERGVETAAFSKHPLGDLIHAAQQLAVAPSESGRCAFCASTLREFRSTGRLGCAQCYASFETSLRELLRRVHGNSRHVGKRYVAPHPGAADPPSKLVELREQLRRAVENEQFEIAAGLRDQIKVLE